MYKLKHVRKAMKVVLSKHGADFVYQHGNDVCQYRPTDEKPVGCIVGETWKALTGAYPTETADEQGGFPEVTEFSGKFTARAEAFLTQAQLIQDRPGKTWGEAFKSAEAWVGQDA